jgi:hypothetical protein
MSKKSYTPTAEYAELKRVERLLSEAQTIADIRKLVVQDGPKVGYKAFCYMLGGQMTPEAMKPDEACLAAALLEQQGHQEQALVIYKRVAAAHPDHALAKSKATS